MTNHNDQPADNGMSMMLMMGLMMGLCIGAFLLLALIPVIGWPLGIALAVIVGGVALYACQRMMRHGH